LRKREKERKKENDDSANTRETMSSRLLQSIRVVPVELITIEKVLAKQYGNFS